MCGDKTAWKTPRILGMLLALLGWLGAIASCALPPWRVSSPPPVSGAAPPLWEGLWMSCSSNGTSARRCLAYDSLLDLPQDLQAARALTLIAAGLGLLATLAGAAGAPCCRAGGDPRCRGNLSVSAGFAFLACGLLMLLTAGWSTHAVRQDFSDPLVTLDAKRQPGASIFLAFAAGGAQLLGGLLLCFSWPREAELYPANFHNASSTARKSGRAAV
ncbi:claudin-4-like [Carcharodon carcharias]|uniref:claudin-4-like n=1 Tax=Carcharodon carcharias TaxID=13397 RepID=UPI001B7E1D6A|nr:claudin-4-like [Carcharodon carcharias]